MSSREKRLLILLGTALFVVVNVFAFNWVKSQQVKVAAEIDVAKQTLELADIAARQRDQVVDEINWLEQHAQETKEAELMQSQLQTLATQEATGAGLTINRPKILPNDESGEHFWVARFEVAVTGQEAALYRWLVKLHDPTELRAVTNLRLSPNREDDAKIDAVVEVGQWFIPKIVGDPDQPEPTS